MIKTQEEMRKEVEKRDQLNKLLVQGLRGVDDLEDEDLL